MAGLARLRSFWSSLFNKQAPLVIGPAQPTLINPAERAALIVGPAPLVRIEPIKTTVIEPPSRPYWDERGWTRQQVNGHSEYVGIFQVTARRTGQRHTFPGRVIEQNRRYPEAYIAAPPHQLRQHPKWPCFRHQGGQWYRVDWYRPAHHPDQAILYVEKVLAEALTGS